jgi:hypothetical protein
VEATMATVEFKKEFSGLYKASAYEASVVDVPAMKFITVSGAGYPGPSGEFQDGIAALYAVAYTLKFSLKKTAGAGDFAVMPLEALWWTESGKPLDQESRENWCWTVMMALPGFVTKTLVKKAVKEAAERKELPALKQVELERIQEGLSAQIKHKGPYTGSDPTVKRLHDFIAEQGLKPHGKHHEIYLNDPSRTAPEKIRTIIRQPVR